MRPADGSSCGGRQKQMQRDAVVAGKTRCGVSPGKTRCSMLPGKKDTTCRQAKRDQQLRRVSMVEQALVQSNLVAATTPSQALSTLSQPTKTTDLLLSGHGGGAGRPWLIGVPRCCTRPEAAKHMEQGAIVVDCCVRQQAAAHCSMLQGAAREGQKLHGAGML